MSEDMVERVAEAIDAAMSDAAGFERERAIAGARAAIEAMREPTEEMAIAGAIGIGGHMPSPLDAADAWRAMIDAALQER